jgi:hypothetical protein
MIILKTTTFWSSLKTFENSLGAKKY